MHTHMYGIYLYDHHITLPARISVILSSTHLYRPSLPEIFQVISCIGTELLYIGSSWSSCFVHSYEGVNRNILLISSSLLLHQNPTCLVCLTFIVFMMDGWWLYNCCLLRCCLQNLFKTARSILIYIYIYIYIVIDR